MKFTAQSGDLLKALSTVGGAVPAKSTLPILECILFEADGESLKLTATDLEMTVIAKLKVEFESTFSSKGDRIAIPARRMLDTLRALPDMTIQVSTGDDFEVNLKTDQGQYKMVGQDGAEYPSVQAFEPTVQIEASTALLQRTINRTSFAASKDTLRPAMMGIYFNIDAEKTIAVSTDGHRLVKMILNSVNSEEASDFIVPVKALSLASKAGDADTCILTVGSGYAGFDYGDTKVLARLIDESYPNYDAVIPNENDQRLSVNRNAMLAAVKRVSLYSSSMTHQIRLGLHKNDVEISAEDVEKSSEASERVLCSFDGEDMEIGFNSVYLTEVLSNMEADEIVFEFSSPNRAGVVRPAEQAEDEDILMLIMPVMLNSYA